VVVQRGVVGGVLDVHRYHVVAERLGRPPTPLPVDDLVAARRRLAHQDRLANADLCDRVLEPFEGRVRVGGAEGRREGPGVSAVTGSSAKRPPGAPAGGAGGVMAEGLPRSERYRITVIILYDLLSFLIFLRKEKVFLISRKI
jgi:hypothetical protein